MAVGLDLNGDVIECHPNSLAALSLIIRGAPKMSTESFIGSVKVKRDEAVEYFLSGDFLQAMADDAETPEAVVQKGVDTLVGGILDVLNEQYDEIITAETEDGTPALISCVSDLSTIYFEEVSS